MLLEIRDKGKRDKRIVLAMNDIVMGNPKIFSAIGGKWHEEAVLKLEI